jgi:hypothetical protein
MPYMEIITLFSEIHTQHRNTFSGQKLEFLIVKMEVVGPVAQSA